MSERERVVRQYDSPTLEERHYLRNFFESFEFEHDPRPVAEDAKSLSEYFTVWQEQGLAWLSFIKNENSSYAIQIVTDINLEKLQSYAKHRFDNAFRAIRLTPEQYVDDAVKEKNKWRRLLSASSLAVSRMQEST